MVMSTNPNNICVKLDNNSVTKLNSTIHANFSLDELVAIEAVKQNKVLRPLENHRVRKIAKEEETTEEKEDDPLEESKNYLTHIMPSAEYAIKNETRIEIAFGCHVYYLFLLKV